MWIKQIKKQNAPNGKTFYQYQLTETYRVDGKVMHKAVLYLGNHELLHDKNTRKLLGNVLENKIRNTASLFADMTGATEEILRLVEVYYERYLIKIGTKQSPEQIAKAADKREFVHVDPASTTVFDCREIGSEWMCRKMLDRIDLRGYLEKQGWDSKTIELALVSIISRAVACFSEHKTEKWLQQNSSLSELFESLPEKISRHYLYKSADQLYGIKEELEKFFYGRMTSMFDIDDKIVIYDLTNTYFEGRKDGSLIAKYGRSKEKRYDCKQVVLAAVINRYGFLKHSRIYEGNMSDPATLSDIVGQLQKNEASSHEHVIVMDAGIASEANLEMLRAKGLKYVCVSRSKLKNYQGIDLSNPSIIKDKKGSEIKLKTVETEASTDTWLYVESRGKALKEESMLAKAIERFEQEMEGVKAGISKKGCTKKTEKVWERIGRIKERNSSVQQQYNIEVKSDGDKVSEIQWHKKPSTKPQSGIYFIRTNSNIENETVIWDIYNTVREVESTFRCLKTDLNLRPVYHQNDCRVEAHLHLGLLAYQIVAPIRHILKSKGISLSWKNIIRVMNTQKAVSVKQTTKDGDQLVIRTCSRPTAEALEIYQNLGISSMPFKMKKSVVHH